jgi:hypothetical protein
MQTFEQIMAALYVALCEAAGGERASQIANQVLRDAIEDSAVDDPTAISFLRSLSEHDDHARLTAH